MNISINLSRTLARRGLLLDCVNTKSLVPSRFHSVLGSERAACLLALQPCFSQQVRYAARKGTRERKAKKKVKVEEKKEEFVPYKIRQAMLNVPTQSKRVDESKKPDAIDNVYCMRYFKSRVYTVAEAIECLRESNHPTIYNNPDGVVYASLELDLSLDKKNRYLDAFSRILLLPHYFSMGPIKRVLAFCKTQETEQAALAAGAVQVGGLDLIKRVQVGETSLNDYDHIVAHTNMVTDITPLRGLLKKKFPSTKTGSIGSDIGKIVERYAKGIEYTSIKDQHELDYGAVEVPFGKLSMPTDQLEANLEAVLKDIHQQKARSSKPMITRCVIKSFPTTEKLRIDHETYVGKSEPQQKAPVHEDKEDNEKDDEDREEEVDEKQKVAN